MAASSLLSLFTVLASTRFLLNRFAKILYERFAFDPNTFFRFCCETRVFNKAVFKNFLRLSLSRSSIFLLIVAAVVPGVTRRVPRPFLYSRLFLGGSARTLFSLRAALMYAMWLFPLNAFEYSAIICFNSFRLARFALLFWDGAKKLRVALAPLPIAFCVPGNHLPAISGLLLVALGFFSPNGLRLRNAARARFIRLCGPFSGVGGIRLRGHKVTSVAIFLS